MKKILSLAFVLFLCVGAIEGQYERFAVSNIDDSLLKGATSVVRQDDTVVELKNGAAIYTVTHAETFLEKSNENEISFNAYYKDEIEKVKDIEVVILDGEGKLVKKIKKKDLQTTNCYSYSLISDQKVISYSHNTLQYPTTFLFSYTYIDKSPTHVTGWMPIDQFDTAVEESSYTLINTDGLALEPRPSNFEAYHVIKEGNTYRLSGHRAITSEKYMPTLSEVLPILSYQLADIKYFDLETSVQSWTELSDWIYRDMYVPQQTCTPAELTEDLKAYVGSETDPLAIAKKLYSYIQDHFRYVAIGLDDGGYIPLDTKKVHELRYGDCKALSHYYKTLLEAYGIESDLVLVNSGEDYRPFDKDRVTPVAFDHVINSLTIDGDEYWVDCTSTSNPFGYLGAHSDARPGLAVRAGGGTLTTTPSYPSKVVYNLATTLSQSGIIAGDIEVLSNGIPMDYKLMLLPMYTEKEYGEYLTDKLLKKYDRCEILDKSYSLDTAALTLKEKYTFEADGQAEQFGNYLLVDGNNISLKVPKLSKDANRVFPVHFNRAIDVAVKETMTVPVGAYAKPLDDVVLESPYGTYHHKISTAEHTVTIDRHLTIKAGTYPAEEYKAIKTFFDKVRKTERRQLTINMKS